MAPEFVRRFIQYAGLRYLLARELLEAGAAFDPFDKRYLSDPYPLYRKLREKDPVHRSRLFDGVIMTRYQDVQDVLKDSRFSADDRNGPDFERQRRAAVAAGVLTEEESAEPPSMLRLDPPDHTRLRSLVNRAFTPRAVEALRPRVEAIVDELLDRVADSGRMDVVRDLAYPLPVIVIAEMLGIPAEDRDQFKEWSDAVAAQLGFAQDFSVARRAQFASRELRAYLSQVVEQRRREPRDDLISALIAAEQEGEKLTTHEVFATTELLLIAGNETTTNLIGNGLLALLKHPDQMELLRRQPDLMPQAVEELLRYDSPVQATSRLPLEDLDWRGERLRRGQQVMLVIGAANRDPEQFPNPERLDVTRKDVRHLSFGHGIHFCLGAPLARLEAPIALNAMLQRFSDLRFSDWARPEWGTNFILHGLRSLPVEFSPPPARPASTEAVSAQA
jgi:cytochrome P450